MNGVRDGTVEFWLLPDALRQVSAPILRLRQFTVGPFSEDCPQLKTAD